MAIVHVAVLVLINTSFTPHIASLTHYLAIYSFISTLGKLFAVNIAEGASGVIICFVVANW